MKKKPQTLKLILASQSPRRQEILKDAGYRFATFPSNSSESFSENLTLKQNLLNVAKGKVEAVLEDVTIQYKKDFLVLGADTVVVLGKHVLGKPKNRSHGRRMLQFMAGKTHQVYTCYYVYNGLLKEGFGKIVTTKVGFRELMRSEIEDYLDSGEPFDKAGAYGIQGLARAFINTVKGDLLNVVGLPLHDFETEIRKRGWLIERIAKRRR